MFRKNLLFELKKGFLVRKINGWEETKAIAVTSDGKYLLSGTSSKVEIYDLKSVKTPGSKKLSLDNIPNLTVVKTIQFPDDSLQALCVSPDNTMFAASFYSQCAICHFSEQNELIYLEGFYFKVLKLNFTPDGKLIIGSNKKCVMIWDVETRKLLQILPGHFEVKGFSDDGRMVYSSSDKGHFLWNPLQWVEFVPGHTKKISGLQFIDYGKQIVSSSADGTMIFWDVLTGAPLKQIHPLLDFDFDHFSDNGDHLGYDNILLSPVSSLTKSPDGNFLFVISDLEYDRRVCSLWDWKTKKAISFFVAKNYVFNDQDLGITPDNKYVLLKRDESITDIWNLKTGKKIKVIKSPGSNWYDTSRLFEQGKKLLSFPSNQAATIWQIPEGTVIKELKENHSNVNYAEITPDEKHVVMASADGNCIIQELMTGKIKRELSGHTGKINTLALSPDGKYLITAAEDQLCLLWDLESATILHKLSGYKQKVSHVAFVNKEKNVLTISLNTCILWDITSGNKLDEHECLEDICEYAICENSLALGTISGNLIFLKL